MNVDVRVTSLDRQPLHVEHEFQIVGKQNGTPLVCRSRRELDLLFSAFSIRFRSRAPRKIFVDLARSAGGRLVRLLRVFADEVQNALSRGRSPGANIGALVQVSVPNIRSNTTRDSSPR